MENSVLNKNISKKTAIIIIVLILILMIGVLGYYSIDIFELNIFATEYVGVGGPDVVGDGIEEWGINGQLYKNINNETFCKIIGGEWHSVWGAWDSVEGCFKEATVY